MLRRQGELLVAAAAIAFAIGVACSSSDDTNNASSSSGGAGQSSSGTATGKGFHQCPPANTPANCTAADVDGFDTCVVTKCDAQLKQCNGPGYQDGTFSGPCAALVTCQQKCSCADSQCMAACPVSAQCSTCQQGFSTCSSTCQVPACFKGNASSSSSSSSGSPGPFTCAQLMTCCAKIPAGSEQDQCNQIAINGEDAGVDNGCNISYSTFSEQATGGCD